MGSFFPLDYHLGLECFTDRFSLAMQKKVSKLGALLPYRSASKEVEYFLGTPISHPTVQKYTNKFGEKASSIPVRDLHKNKDKDRVISIQIDGGRVRTRKKGWKETKTVIIDDGKDRIQFTMLADHKTFMAKVKELICRYGYDKHHCKVCLVCDGAVWIGDDFAEMFPDIEQILDYYHFKEHLYDTAKILFGESDKQKIKKFVRTLCNLAFEDDVDHLLEALEKLKDTYQEKTVQHESLRKLYNYLHKNRFRIRYGVFREHGLPIGSGKVEATIKNMNSGRLKSASIQWDEFNVQRIINLRTLIANNQWEELKYTA